MASACTYGSVKIILVTFTSIIMALGAALLAIGIYLTLNDDSVYLAEEEVSGFDASTVIFIGIAAGAAMILVALIGLVGVLTKSPEALTFFLILLLITLGLEIGAGTTGFIWRDDVPEDLPDEMEKKLRMYDSDQDVKKAWDKIHEKHKCCGRMGTQDWVAAIQKNVASCETRYQNVGCYYEVEKSVKRSLEMASAAIISLALFQMLVICFTGLMIIKLKRGEGKYRRTGK